MQCSYILVEFSLSAINHTYTGPLVTSQKRFANFSKVTFFVTFDPYDDIKIVGIHSAWLTKGFYVIQTLLCS